MQGLWRLLAIDPRRHTLVLVMKQWERGSPPRTLLVHADAKHADLFDPGDLWELPGWVKKESGRNPWALPPG